MFFPGVRINSFCSAIFMSVHFPGYQFSGSFYTYSPTETHPVAVDPNMRSAEAMAISGKSNHTPTFTWLITIAINAALTISMCVMAVNDTSNSYKPGTILGHIAMLWEPLRTL